MVVLILNLLRIKTNVLGIKKNKTNVLGNHDAYFSI